MTNPDDTISLDHTRTPVAIGGLGGSGTRVFAASLRNAGFAIGSMLNAPLDNLWFTTLFKRRTWSRDVLRGVEELKHYVETGEWHPRKIKNMEAEQEYLTNAA